MTVRPILFSGPMVEALVDGRKNQTRRISWRSMRVDDPDFCGCGGVDGADWNDPACWGWMSDAGQWLTLKGDVDTAQAFLGYEVGDLLWVRETFAQTWVSPLVETIDRPWVVYRAADNRTDYGGPWKPSIFMPRRASRITLRVNRVRAERLQDITEHDAEREGAKPSFENEFGAVGRVPFYRHGFRKLWDGINARRGYPWVRNPWVVALTFDVYLENVDSVLRTNGVAA